MKDKNERCLLIEAPDKKAVVDFIDLCVVTIELVHNKLLIDVKADRGDGYTWDEHDFEVVLPEPGDLGCAPEAEREQS